MATLTASQHQALANAWTTLEVPLSLLRAGSIDSEDANAIISLMRTMGKTGGAAQQVAAQPGFAAEDELPGGAPGLPPPVLGPPPGPTPLPTPVQPQFAAEDELPGGFPGALPETQTPIRRFPPTGQPPGRFERPDTTGVFDGAWQYFKQSGDVNYIRNAIGGWFEGDARQKGQTISQSQLDSLIDQTMAGLRTEFGDVQAPQAQGAAKTASPLTDVVTGGRQLGAEDETRGTAQDQGPNPASLYERVLTDPNYSLGQWQQDVQVMLERAGLTPQAAQAERFRLLDGFKRAAAAEPKAQPGAATGEEGQGFPDARALELAQTSLRNLPGEFDRLFGQQFQAAPTQISSSLQGFLRPAAVSGRQLAPFLFPEQFGMASQQPTFQEFLQAGQGGPNPGTFGVPTLDMLRQGIMSAIGGPAEGASFSKLQQGISNRLLNPAGNQELFNLIMKPIIAQLGPLAQQPFAQQMQAQFGALPFGQSFADVLRNQQFSGLEQFGFPGPGGF